MNQGRRPNQIKFACQMTFFGFIGCALITLILILSHV